MRSLLEPAALLDGLRERLLEGLFFLLLDLEELRLLLLLLDDPRELPLFLSIGLGLFAVLLSSLSDLVSEWLDRLELLL